MNILLPSMLLNKTKKNCHNAFGQDPNGVIVYSKCRTRPTLFIIYHFFFFLLLYYCAINCPHLPEHVLLLNHDRGEFL
uniref:Uncharacterized protein n=1 Tax=Lepeophtheirus salmonis TaxID=72036 RepID=A0A0K2TLF8_LEPSM